MKRRLRWLRLRILKSARYHYMVGVTAAVVAVAAAAGLGAFDPDDGSRQQEPRQAQAPIPVGTALGPTQPPFLTVTYVLVGTEEERDVWHNVEETINQRELLSRMALEVLVVTDAEEEIAAYELIDAIRARYPWNEYVIQDLRMK
jgi:hypothetical protein